MAGIYLDAQSETALLAIRHLWGYTETSLGRMSRFGGIIHRNPVFLKN